MADYDALTDRIGTQALMPEDAAQLISAATQESAVMSLFRRVPMSRAQTRIPVTATLPTAFFVTGDTGMKKATQMTWDNVYLNVEDIAVMAPIPQNVLDDAGYDIFGSVKPQIVSEIGRVLDGAVLFGVNKPASWPDSLADAAAAANNEVAELANDADEGGIAKDISDVMSLVEADGYDVTGFAAVRGMRGKLRGARDTTGQKLLDVSTNEIEGQPIYYGGSGLWGTDAGDAELIAGDFRQAVLGIRQDITWTVITEGVITDEDKNIIYNLPQQDMVALRAVFRVAFAVPNIINRDNADADSRYPFARLNRAS